MAIRSIPLRHFKHVYSAEKDVMMFIVSGYNFICFS